MNKVYNTAFFLTVVAFLSLTSERLSAQLKANFAESANPNTKTKVLLDDQVLYIKKEITGGGTINLLTGNTENLVGICNFDKNRLNQGRAFVFDQIAFNYKSDAAAGNEGNVTYNAAAPAVLQNADFVIIQNNIEVLRLPVRDISNIATGLTAADEYTQLKSLRLIDDVNPITMQIQFPESSAGVAAGTHHYVYVRLSGLQTSTK